MKSSASASVLFLAAHLASALAASSGTPTAEACAIVSSTWAAQLSATATPTADASIAYECLNSVPIDKEAALKFVDELEPYLDWQSDVVFKKSPPADYFYPPYDVYAELAAVRADLVADVYPNEYAWQSDLYLRVFGPAHDGHFVVYSDALSAAVEWQRPLALVSISEDGSSSPVIKIYSDVINAPDTASVVTMINGVDAATYLQDWIYQAAGNQDADAAYNTMFFEKAFVAGSNSEGYFQSGGRVRYIYPGNSTSFAFENGTSIELSNVARLKGSWTGVVDGASFFETFCSGAAASALATSTTTPATATATSTSTAAPTTSVVGYPQPVVITSDAIVSGYFIDEEGFEDVAVLSMLAFESNSAIEFQATVQDFFAAAVDAGKTRLVVDVQANGGGYIFLGYDAFRQIFPDIVQEGIGRWRASDQFLAIVDVYSGDSADFDADTASPTTIWEYESVYNWRYDLNVSNEDFTGFEDKFPPLEFLGNNFTNFMQWDFNDPLTTSNDTYGFGTDITGYGSRQNFTRPFGGPENVVLLLDGYCASTCTLFAEFLRANAGVKSIAMGGRPAKEGRIQGVGGVKGAQSYSFGNALSDAQVALDSTGADESTREALGVLTNYVSDRSTAAGLNVKDQILRANLDDGLPAQFVVEESDCRLYWTAAMHQDITELWKAAATAAFKGGDCAYGSASSGPQASARLAGGDATAPSDSSRFTPPHPRQAHLGRRTSPQKTDEFDKKYLMRVID